MSDFYTYYVPTDSDLTAVDAAADDATGNFLAARGWPAGFGAALDRALPQSLDVSDCCMLPAVGMVVIDALVIYPAEAADPLLDGVGLREELWQRPWHSLSMCCGGDVTTYGSWAVEDAPGAPARATCPTWNTVGR